jgi:hypothetical protein
MLSQEYLKSRLSYDPDTGVFVWRRKEVTDGKDISWNTRFSGKVAGTVERRGYRRITINAKLYWAHRLAWLYVHGEMPENDIDHIDGDPLNNRIENLRDVSHADNGKNAKRPARNTSGVVGVVWDSCNRKWRAQITVNQKNMHIGRYIDKADAIAARAAAEVRHGFHENHGRW